MGFSKEFFPIKVFPQGHGFNNKGFSPQEGFFLKDQLIEDQEKDIDPEKHRRKQRVFLKIGFSQNKTKKQPPTPQTMNERRNKGAEVTKYNVQVSHMRDGFFLKVRLMTPKSTGEKEKGFPKNRFFPEQDAETTQRTGFPKTRDGFFLKVFPTEEWVFSKDKDQP